LEQIALTEAIAALREELTAAITAGGDESLNFEVGTVTMEFEVAVERGTAGKGGLNIWVLSLGAEESRSHVRTHRLTLPLTPLREDGRPILTGEAHIPD
jgi:hypothetical protein